MNYIKFTEDNDWEGETWYFFIQATENNIAQLKKIDSKIEDSFFSIDFTEMPEEEVDILIKHSPSGYMMMFNKKDGELDIPSDIDFDGDDDAFYKGGILDLIK